MSRRLLWLGFRIWAGKYSTDRISPMAGSGMITAVKGGEKMYRVGGSTGVFGRLKTVPPGAFHSADIQTVEGAMDVLRGDVFSGAAGLPGGGDERSGCPASTIFAGWRQSVLPVHLLGLDALLGSVAVRPSYMCKSEPQIQEEVIFTMPSLGCCSSGSGTFSAAILNGAW